MDRNRGRGRQQLGMGYGSQPLGAQYGQQGRGGLGRTRKLSSNSWHGVQLLRVQHHAGWWSDCCCCCYNPATAWPACTVQQPKGSSRPATSSSSHAFISAAHSVAPALFSRQRSQAYHTNGTPSYCRCCCCPVTPYASHTYAQPLAAARRAAVVGSPLWACRAQGGPAAWARVGAVLVVVWVVVLGGGVLVLTTERCGTLRVCWP